MSLGLFQELYWFHLCVALLLHFRTRASLEYGPQLNITGYSFSLFCIQEEPFSGRPINKNQLQPNQQARPPATDIFPSSEIPKNIFRLVPLLTVLYPYNAKLEEQDRGKKKRSKCIIIRQKRHRETNTCTRKKHSFLTFAVHPVPASPQCTALLPIDINRGRASSIPSSVPPHIKVRVPSAAAGTPPLTGASSIVIPWMLG